MTGDTRDTSMWSRFVAAGRQLQAKAPGLWPLVVQLVEGAAEPDSVSVEDLQELAATAMHRAWTMPTTPFQVRPIPPSRALSDWRLVDSEAHAVTVERIEMLTPESIAEIAQWARAVAEARRDEFATIHHPRPAVAEQLLAELA